MKRIRNWILSGLLAMMLAGGALAGDFQKGLKAYEAGDYATALAEFTPIAEAGDSRAAYLLGVMYREGEGILQDYVEAVKWWLRAAEAGDAAAQYSLGSMYNHGKGVPEDKRFAYMWFNLAAAQGYEEARTLRDWLANRIMTPAQTNEAQEMSRKCLAQNYKNCP